MRIYNTEATLTALTAQLSYMLLINGFDDRCTTIVKCFRGRCRQSERYHRIETGSRHNAIE